MRPIQLSLQYFGSYTEKQTIDFDRLGTTGLYLITGDTGSGKTTLFDAIVFALYGKMSGAYRKDDDMRCSMAEETDKTEVTLTFELNGRQYTIRRWLGYKRPNEKKKGELMNDGGGVELTLPDEERPIRQITAANSKIEEILGITCTQFAQIAMIAQGDFMRLLMAETKDRIDLFRKIFRTEKYRQLQDMIKEKFLQEDENYKKAKVEINTYIKMAQCAEDSPLKPLLVQVQDDKDGKIFIPVTRMIETVRQITAEDKDLLERRNTLKGQQEQIIRQCDARLAVIRSHEEAAQELPKREQELKRLQDIDLPCKTAERAEAEKAKEQIRTLNDAAAKTEGSLGDYDELDRQREKYARADAILNGIAGPAGRRAKNEADFKEADEYEKRFSDELAQLGNPEAVQQSLKTRQSEIEQYEKDLKALENKRGSLLTAQGVYKDLMQKATEAETAYMRMRNLFYAAQAGILAETLEEGRPCPVCGATHHPFKAQKAEEAPTKEQLDEAETNANDKRVLANRKAEECNGMKGAVENEEKRLTSLGLSVDAEELKNLPTKIKALQDQIDENNKKIKRKNDIPALLERIKKRREQLSAEKEAITRDESAADADKKAADRQIRLLIRKCVFPNKNAARQAATEKRAEAQQLQKRIDDAIQALNSINGDIQKVTGKIDTLQKTLKNIVTLDRTEETDKKSAATAELEDRIKPAIQTIESRNSTNTRALTRLENKKEEIEEIEARYSWLKTLSDTVNGKLNGKERIMLETYILSAYFERVIQKANLRLLKMTNNQYELLRKKEADSNSRQSGLDLDVIDHHSGKIRTVKSLSGGESFMASLSLALGLSDEIQSRAGGIRLDTMFVDEGFGSLDEDTRIQARNTLQKLSQEGHLLMGVISHVPELRTIEKQIQVHKDFNGVSTAKVVLL